MQLIHSAFDRNQCVDQIKGDSVIEGVSNVSATFKKVSQSAAEIDALIKRGNSVLDPCVGNNHCTSNG